SSGTLTISQGIYSSIKVSGSATLLMNPGIYVLAGGGMTTSQSAIIKGTGVLIYNAGSNYPNGGGNFGGISLANAGGLTLSAATTGTYAGIVIFQSRDNTRAISFSAPNGTGLSGTIYAPNAPFNISGGSLQVGLVVDTLTISSGASLTQTSTTSTV